MFTKTECLMWKLNSCRPLMPWPGYLVFQESTTHQVAHTTAVSNKHQFIYSPPHLKLWSPCLTTCGDTCVMSTEATWSPCNRGPSEMTRAGIGHCFGRMSLLWRGLHSAGQDSSQIQPPSYTPYAPGCIGLDGQKGSGNSRIPRLKHKNWYEYMKAISHVKGENQQVWILWPAESVLVCHPKHPQTWPVGALCTLGKSFVLW